ncbi:MAG: hypothetical protein QOE33_499 [Acidobacteriota bacterium]|nr:hypothetical protein [Acidobacteriota bacterium]
MKLRARLATLLLALLLAASPTFGQRHSRHTSHRAAQVSGGYYTNSVGHRVRRPSVSRSVPVGASARCRDGSYSFSEHRRGTCSHHGGVAQWL